MPNLSSDQKQALEKLQSWYNNINKDQYITLGGYAGTGKTTLISIFRKKIPEKVRVAFVCYTGKASRVLNNKLKEQKSIYGSDYVGTIHSLIYSPVENEHGDIIGWEKKALIDADLVIIDEASMVNRDIWIDLLSYGIPIVAVGDHGQLPPIHGTFSLMKHLDIRLERIHRQARDNPIIKISTLAREVGKIPHGHFGHNIQKLKKGTSETQEFILQMMERFNDNTLILCGYNATRVKLNKLIREKLGFRDPEPQKRDRVICLRNNHQEKIFNGMLGTIIDIKNAKENGREDKDWYEAQIKMDDEIYPYNGLISKKQFNNPESMNFTKKRAEIMKGDLFDFGYAITVHKAQGSQASRVILIEERFPSMDDEMWRRWLYTAVTRAERELIIVG